MIFKTCSRCGLVKPPNSFYLKTGTPDGRNSRCVSCVAELEKHPLLRQAGNNVRSEVVRGIYADPPAFGRAVCEYVSAYVQKQIDRFEGRTGNEAPPHLTAILELSQQLAISQNPTPRQPRYLGKCVVCEGSFRAYRRDKLFCSERCRSRSSWKTKKTGLGTKVCAHCGDSYWPYRSNQKFCSQRCLWTSRNKRTSERRAAAREASRQAVPG